MNVFHYADRSGWNAIRSQMAWQFRASQPSSNQRPNGAYFTTIEPSPQNLRTLCKRLRIPKTKQEFVFWFVGTEELQQLNNGRGRDEWILHSSVDYNVEPDRQQENGETENVKEVFS